MTQEPSNNAKSVLNMSNQESKQLTRECIRTALLQLLKDEPFENITITAIILPKKILLKNLHKLHTRN